ncbi:MAG TPA: site-2 protease family protein [Candidatus Eisenbacteria bacterium]
MPGPIVYRPPVRPQQQPDWAPPPFGPPIVIRPNWPLHIALFLATIATTWFTGGPLYAASVLAILLSHEMGHYLTALHYRVPATPPYFIPMPFGLFGTFGAVIRMATQGANRRILFDIAVAGPIAGMVLAVPACVIGLRLSRVVTVANAGEIHLGSSLLFQWLSDLVVGKLGPGQDIELHPVAFAGWAGLFVTSLNLIPVGQLDGGHVAYALLGRRAHKLAYLVAAGFVALTIFVSWSWLVVAVMVALFGLRHPPTGDDWTPVDTKRMILGVFLLLMFVITFTPRPLQ